MKTAMQHNIEHLKGRCMERGDLFNLPNHYYTPVGDNILAMNYLGFRIDVLGDYKLHGGEMEVMISFIMGQLVKYDIPFEGQSYKRGFMSSFSGLHYKSSKALYLYDGRFIKIVGPQLYYSLMGIEDLRSCFNKG